MASHLVHRRFGRIVPGTLSADIRLGAATRPLLSDLLRDHVVDPRGVCPVRRVRPRRAVSKPPAFESAGRPGSGRLRGVERARSYRRYALAGRTVLPVRSLLARRRLWNRGCPPPQRIPRSGCPRGHGEQDLWAAAAHSLWAADTSARGLHHSGVPRRIRGAPRQRRGKADVGQYRDFHSGNRYRKSPWLDRSAYSNASCRRHARVREQGSSPSSGVCQARTPRQ